MAAGVLLCLLSLAWILSSAACDAEEWLRLKEVLLASARYADFRTVASEEFQSIFSDPTAVAWYRDRYQDCVEGFLSLVLYLSLHANNRDDMIPLAEQVAVELNPLALQQGETFLSWPMFDRLADLHLLWDWEKRKLEPLSTSPRYDYYVLMPAPLGSSGEVLVRHQPVPLLSALNQMMPLQLLDFLRDGNWQKVSAGTQWHHERRPVIFDVGVFDGMDWAKSILEHDFIGVGFEPVRLNREKFQHVFPYLAQVEGPLEVEPGNALPRQQPTKLQAALRNHSAGAPGHFLLIGAALGESHKNVSVLTRYDYSSIAIQGYMYGPKDVEKETCAVVSLDGLFEAGYFGSELKKIDILKVDVEGYEMGVLRGAERLLKQTSIHFLIFEYQPMMLASTGTDHEGILHFVAHYGFQCYSYKLDNEMPVSFRAFAERYTRPDRLRLQGYRVSGTGLEDIICENRYFTPW